MAIAGLAALAALGCQSAPVPGAACTRDGECAAPLSCRFGRCRTGCVADRDCGEGVSCLLDAAGLGTCALATDLGCETGVGRECASGLVCVADRCAQICDAGHGCATGSSCVPSGTGVSFCAPTGTDAAVPRDAPAPDDAGANDAGMSDAGLGDGAVGTACIGEGFVCATRASTGQPYCWGNDAHRALGFDPGVTGDLCDGNSPRGSDHPLAVPLMDVDELACGRSWVCAHRASDGTVHCWGDANLGNIDPGVPSICERNPQQIDRTRVSYPSGGGRLLASTQLVCALSTEGSGFVRCWGGDQGTVYPRDPGDPVIQPLGTVVDLAADLSPSPLPASFVPTLLAFDDGLPDATLTFGGGCAADAQGRLACWGATSVGQGGGVYAAPLETGVFVSGVNDVRALVRGQGVTCWLDAGGALSCMGVGEHGELAASPGTLPDQCMRPSQTLACSASPLTLAEATFSEISANASSVALCGIASGGAGYTVGDVYCWGSGEFVQNGNLTNGSNARPLDGHIRIANGDGLHHAVHVFTGWYAACAIDEGGMLWCWGTNTGQALRDPDPAREIDRATPMPLP
ncbi:MAG: hypothetical protein U0234_06325 [Sandaracinus sp.]